MSERSFVVVGGSHGIGLGIVNRLLARGDTVAVLSRTRGQLDPNVRHVAFDVLADKVDVDVLPETIDGLAYCPGSINLGPIRSLKPDELVEDFRLNVVGAANVLQAALPALKAADKSSVVLFSTVAVQQGLALHAGVATVKAAVEGLMRSCAAELAPHIRVNCIAPSLTETPLAEKFLSSDSKRAALADRHPLKRVGSVDDIAAAAEFLLTDVSSWITGQVMSVDGGMSTLRV